MNSGVPLDVVSACSRSPTSTLRSVITPSNGATMRSKPTSACSRCTVASCAWRLASATAMPAWAEATLWDCTFLFALSLSAVWNGVQPSFASVVDRRLVTTASS